MEDQLIYWLFKEEQGALSAEERKALDAWRASSGANEQQYIEYRLILDAEPHQPAPPDPDASWRSFQQRLGISKADTRPIVGLRYWLPRVAALLLLAAGIGYLLMPSGRGQTWVAEKSPVAVQLRDGTDVLLGAESRLLLQNPGNWDTERRVSLEGMAFFEVASDHQRPFLIEAGDLLIRVLGTAFNVTAHPEEDHIEVLVTAGRVGVHLERQTEPVVLGPGDGLIWDKPSGRAQQFRITTTNHLAWHDGILQFNGTPLPEVGRDLSRHFNVRIRVDESLSGCRLNSRFEQATLGEILETLKLNFDLTISTLPEGGYELLGRSCD